MTDMQSNQPHLEVAGLSVFAADMQLVRDVSLTVARGGVLTLLGESGSGKSLLAQAIMGNLPTSLQCSGHIRIGGHASDAGQPQARRALWGRSLALLPQEPWLALDPTMRVKHQIAETYELVSSSVTNMQADRMQEAKARALESSLRDLRSLGLEAAADKYPFMISGGMAQRVAFLATHAAGAPMLIIDEPTKGLDSDRRNDILEMLRAAIAAGMTLLTITHDVWLARELGGNVAVMLDGQIVEHGDAVTVLHQPRHVYTRRLLAAEPAAWEKNEVVLARTGGTGDTIAHIENVGKSFGTHRLFGGISEQIRRGEFIAVTGPSGSGKTSFGNIMLSLLKPDSGSVVRSDGLAPTAFQKIYQDPAAAFAPGVTLRRSMLDVIALHKLQWDDLLQLLARLRLQPALLDRLPSQVSGGELQRFAMARVLMLKPALIFADEPTSRLDPITQQETLALLVEHAAANDCAVVLVTHDLQIAEKITGRQINLGV